LGSRLDCRESRYVPGRDPADWRDHVDAQLIGPGALEADAVVPQCLDNQYVSDDTFTAMLARGADYRDSEIATLRESAFKTEFIRSLVYTSQIVIQRASFKNSEFLFRQYRPELGENLRAFAALIRERAIIPFLFAESSLDDRLEFDTRAEGDQALRALLDEVAGDMTCVRLAVNDDANRRATDGMAAAFGAGLMRLLSMSGEQRNAMASELFAAPDRLQAPGAWKAFEGAIDQLVDYTVKKARTLREADKLITRTDVYRDNFCLEAKDSVVNGRFREPSADQPFLLELKKYVDLVYNTNLPDRLKRYTFTPAGMPSRLALQDDPRMGYPDDAISHVVADGAVLESIRRTFEANVHRAMTLPLLRDLTVADIRQIRALPEWSMFKDSQVALLREPLRCLELIGTFQRDFDQFQRALSSWYSRTHGQVRTEQRYVSLVSLALSVAGKTIVAGSNLGIVEKAAGIALSDAVIASIPRKIKGIAAKLLVGVYDVGRRQLDADRTYTIELMQSSADLSRDDVIGLLASIDRRRDDAVPGSTSHMADQGIL
jgi:hypothetical protein